MRQVPTRYAIKQPALTKKASIAEVAHISAPLKGMSLSSKLTAADPLTATILKNFVVEDDRIQCRAGYRCCRRTATPAGLAPDPVLRHPGAAAGGHQRQACRRHHGSRRQDRLHRQRLALDVLQQSRLSRLHRHGQRRRRRLVVGRHRHLHRPGTGRGDQPVEDIRRQDAIGTVAAGDIGKFQNGMASSSPGATGTGMIEANGPQVIDNVGVPANTFTLVESTHRPPRGRRPPVSPPTRPAPASSRKWSPRPPTQP